MIFALLSIFIFSASAQNESCVVFMKDRPALQKSNAIPAIRMSDGGYVVLRTRVLPNGLKIQTTIPLRQFDEERVSDFIDSVAVKYQVVDGTFKLSQFLKEHYRRRLWSADFTDKASDIAMLHDRVNRAIRTLVFDPNGNLIASSAVVFSPYLWVRQAGSEEKKLVPWMNLAHLEKSEKNNFKSLSMTDGLLPVEKFFGVQISRQSAGPEVKVSLNGKDYFVAQGFLVELASYAVDSKTEFKDEAHEELYFEFLINSYQNVFTLKSGDVLQRGSIIDQILNPNFDSNPFFFSYGDSVGQRLYRPFNFRKEGVLTKQEFDVEWGFLAAGKNLNASYITSRGMQSVATRAFDHLQFNQLLEINTGNSWMPFSQAQDMRSIWEGLEFAKKFETVLPQLNDWVLQYQNLNQGANHE